MLQQATFLKLNNQAKGKVASDPAPLAGKEGLVLIACAPFNESLEIAIHYP